VFIHTKNEIGGIAEADICASATQHCAQPNTLIHAARAPANSPDVLPVCRIVARSGGDSLITHKNWRRLIAAVKSALDVFRTRTVYSYMVARANYTVAGLKYRVLTDVLYKHSDFEHRA
jgi:hypothetical protein